MESYRKPSSSDTRTLEYSPFLLQVTIRSPKGDPLPNAQIELWHATTSGQYAYRSYALRGRFTTDANGNAEVLTIVPGDYGAGGNLRTGHFHMMIRDAEGKYDNLTTQVYVCKGNDVGGMQKDLCVVVRLTPHLIINGYLVVASIMFVLRDLRTCFMRGASLKIVADNDSTAYPSCPMTILTLVM